MKFELRMLDLNNERALWLEKTAIAGADIFHSPDYIQAFEAECQDSSFSGKAIYFHFGDESNFILYPMIKKTLNQLPFYNPVKMSILYDIFSPYGYAGPVAYLSDKSIKKELWERFVYCFREYSLRNSIISEFSRLNPYLNNHAPLLEIDSSCIRKASVVFYINLADSEEQIWLNMKKSNRNCITKASREKVSIERTTAPDDIRAFIQIYNETMDQRSAKSSYHFTERFYYSLFGSLKDNVNLFVARHNGCIVSAALFLGNGKFIHYFLSGTKREAKCAGATNLLLYEAIKWAKKSGHQVFDLGGGYRQDDNLSAFKQSFCKTSVDFYVYFKVHDQAKYQLLCDEKDKYDNQATRIKTDYFPYYRR